MSKKDINISMKNWMKMIMIIVIAITILLKSLVMLNLLKFKSKLLTTKWGLLWMWISKLFNNLSICHWAKDCLKKCFWKMTLVMSKSYAMAKLFLATKSSWATRAKFSGVCWASSCTNSPSHSKPESTPSTMLPWWPCLRWSGGRILAPSISAARLCWQKWQQEGLRRSFLPLSPRSSSTGPSHRPISCHPARISKDCNSSHTTCCSKQKSTS